MRRRIEYWARRALGRSPPFILMYHRVADLKRDPWDLAVSPEFFAEQIEVVTRTRRPVTLAQLASDRAPEGAVAITFDDGYIDMLIHAKPVLEKFDCPATMFIPTGLIGEKRDFWWDELGRLIFETPDLPGSLRLETARSGIFVWEHGASGAQDRRALHERLWKWLLPLTHERRRDCLDQLAAQIGASTGGSPHDRSMTADEVRRLLSDLIEIGGHTVTHPAMALLSAEEKRCEAIACQRGCEAILDKPARSFSYPHGSYDEESVAALRIAGFSIACTTEFAPVTPRSRHLELPRVHVKNWDGETFTRRLQTHFMGRSRIGKMMSDRWGSANWAGRRSRDGCGLVEPGGVEPPTS